MDVGLKHWTGSLIITLFFHFRSRISIPRRGHNELRFKPGGTRSLPTFKCFKSTVNSRGVKFPKNFSAQILAGEDFITPNQKPKGGDVYTGHRSNLRRLLLVWVPTPSRRLPRPETMETPVDPRVTNKAGMMEKIQSLRESRGRKIEGYAICSSMSKRNEMKTRYMQWANEPPVGGWALLKNGST